MFSVSFVLFRHPTRASYPAALNPGPALPTSTFGYPTPDSPRHKPATPPTPYRFPFASALQRFFPSIHYTTTTTPPPPFRPAWP
ncbi:hypothetical protein BKA80DRAFT_275355 [Phyllosticta citrichinensis]